MECFNGKKQSTKTRIQKKRKRKTHTRFEFETSKQITNSCPES